MRDSTRLLSWRMDQAQPVTELYWRPGCGFCSRLIRGLEKAGVDFVAHNIWDDPDAAARVRSVARVNETVPTVFVGDWFGVNPSAGEVSAAVDRLNAGA